MKNIKHLCFLLPLLTLAATSCSTMTETDPEAYRMGTFYGVDVDRSGFLDDGEYKAYAWGRADWDNDGYLEETEYAQYTKVYYDSYDLEYESYTVYDTDGDGFIDRTEFNDIPTALLYSAWDYDNDSRVSTEDWDQVKVHYLDQI